MEPVVIREVVQPVVVRAEVQAMRVAFLPRVQEAREVVVEVAVHGGATAIRKDTLSSLAQRPAARFSAKRPQLM